jgi:site-specific recombinase XerD
MAYVPMNIEEAIIKEGNRRRFSHRTIEIYLSCITKFIKFTNKPLGQISKLDARTFLNYLSEKKVAGSTLNVYHMSIRFLLEDVLRKNMKLNIKYSKRPSRLPEFLTKEEVKKLIENIKNPKHKIMISLLYSAGLRVSELLNLKVGDFNLKEKYGFVRQGKGNKDRIFIISSKLERVLIQLIAGIDKEKYVFENNSRERYSTRTIQEIIKNACKRAGILKKVHPHTLRHSFATHLIENGSSLNEVQALLGHKSPETSMIYVHMASPKMINIQSPFDSL